MERAGSDAISADQCWELLRGQSLGRVALSLEALPAILPVQYYVDGDVLRICLGFYDVAPVSVTNTIVAFAVDSLDARSGVGWSVQLQGVVRPPGRVGVDTSCGQPTAGQILDLKPASITGHQVQICPFAAAHASGR